MPTFRFGFKKSGTLGHVTPEQQAILDKLEAGEIAPEEAAEQLGGHAHVFEFGTGPKADEEEDAESEPPGSEVMPALADPRVVRRLHLVLLAVTAFLAALVAFGDATVHDHALTAVVLAFLSLLLFGGLTARLGLYRTPSGTILAAVPLVGAWIVLDWGLLAGLVRWSLYYPGLIVIGLAVCVLIAALMLGFAVRKTRATLDELDRRDRR